MVILLYYKKIKYKKFVNQILNILDFSFLSFNRSFNDKPLKEGVVDAMIKELFEKEQDDLLLDLIDIPKKACDRRVCLS